MSFAKPSLLFLIWVLPPLLGLFIWGGIKRRRILSSFASTKSLAAISPDQSKGRRRVKAGLLLLGIVFLIVALAGPRYGYVWQEIERKGVDIIVALDCSKSMLAQDVKPSRLDRAKREIIDLLSITQGDRMGLVAFAGEAFLQCPLTLDYSSFNIFLEALTPDYLPVGGTDLAGALSVSMKAFKADDATDKAIILITDGEKTDGDTLAVVKKAAEMKIKIFPIGVGSREGVPVPDAGRGFKKGPDGSILLSKLDSDTLKKMAAMTGGTFVRSVAGDMDLDLIYTQGIRKSLEAKSVESSRKKVWENRYQWALLLAILCLVFSLGTGEVKKNGILLMLAALLFLPTPLKAAGLDFETSVEKGVAAYNNGDYESALNHFIEGQLKEPDNPEMDFNIGSAYYRLGRFDEAAASFEAASASKEKALKSKGLYNLGNSRFKKGDLKAAIEAWEAFLKENPQDTKAQENIAFAQKKMKEQKKEQQKKDGDSKKGEQKEDEKSEENSGKQGDRDKKEEKQSPQAGEDKKSSQEGQAEQQKPEEQGASQQKEQEPAQASLPEAKPGDEEMQRAASVLNRLEDKPGGALMRGARKRRVEKDW